MESDFNLKAAAYASQIVILIGMYLILRHRRVPDKVFHYFSQKFGVSKPAMFTARVLSCAFVFSPVVFVSSAFDITSFALKANEINRPIKDLLYKTSLTVFSYVLFTSVSFLAATACRLRSKRQDVFLTLVFCFCAAMYFVVTDNFFADPRNIFVVAELKNRELNQRVDEFLSNSPFRGTAIWLIETKSLNAFASQNGIHLTEGIVNELNQAELNAVIAHEIAHYYNGDAAKGAGFLLIIFIVFSALFIKFISFDKRSLKESFASKGNPNSFCVCVIFFLVMVLVAKVCWTQFIRFNEVRADAGAVKYLIEKQASVRDLETALMKISKNTPEPTYLTDLLMYDHPYIEERIKNIRETESEIMKTRQLSRISSERRN